MTSRLGTEKSLTFFYSVRNQPHKSHDRLRQCSTQSYVHRKRGDIEEVRKDTIGVVLGDRKQQEWLQIIEWARSICRHIGFLSSIFQVKTLWYFCWKSLIYQTTNSIRRSTLNTYCETKHSFWTKWISPYFLSKFQNCLHTELRVSNESDRKKEDDNKIANPAKIKGKAVKLLMSTIAYCSISLVILWRTGMEEANLTGFCMYNIML